MAGRQLNIRLRPELSERVDRYCVAAGIYAPELVRELLGQRLDEWEKEAQEAEQKGELLQANLTIPVEETRRDPNEPALRSPWIRWRIGQLEQDGYTPTLAEFVAAREADRKGLVDA